MPDSYYIDELMNWFTELFTQPTFIQAILILSLISATGLALGKIRIFGVSLGVTFVFFAGIIAGHFGVTVNQEMLTLAQNFGLIIYIYSLGVQVGPGFFSSFKHGGIKLNLLALLLLLVGSLTAMGLFWVTDLSASDTVGLLSGAVTNTPRLGALLSQGLSRVFSNTTVQKHQFFGAQLSS